MEQVPATRSELLARRARLDLARRGRVLLEEKRDQLMEQFRKAADVVLAEAGRLDDMAGSARRSLAFAEAASGPERVRSAALLAQRNIGLSARQTTVAGLRIAEIDHEPLGRGRLSRGQGPTGGTSHIDETADELYAEGRDLRRLVAIIGEASLSDQDRSYLEFADRFETEFVSQQTHCSMEGTLDVAWEVLDGFDDATLKRMSPDVIQRHRPGRKPGEQENQNPPPK